jgi:hypothetical protein
MRHYITIHTEVLPSYRGVDRLTKTAKCACGWEGTRWASDTSVYPGTELLLEVTHHKTDVILDLLQRHFIPS